MKIIKLWYLTAPSNQKIEIDELYEPTIDIAEVESKLL